MVTFLYKSNIFAYLKNTFAENMCTFSLYDLTKWKEGPIKRLDGWNRYSGTNFKAKFNFFKFLRKSFLKSIN